MTLPAYEKLGVFYLGREYDLEESQIRSDYILYDSKDLTTHAVCVGMTGSGKTGLCLSLLEEAAIDHIPVIAIDPKGDLGNLLLTFPNLAGSDFEPWVDESEALRKGQTKTEFASQIASRWREGLAEWDQQAERIQLFRDSSEVVIYTPGSDAGLPVSVVQSFSAPTAAVLNDSDAFRDRVMSAVSSLLALLKIDADPISSREHILLSNIITVAWQQGRNLTIPEIIQQIQKPPFEKVGFMDLETFFGEKDRFQFAISVNNLLASPGFAAWMQGEPLNIEKLLVNSEGKPRISIMSIAHLSDAERMFFVTILLNELLSWVRSQPGTNTLRAILYMDEVFGYFPPTANPPSKRPMLTLLKQARAFGVGVVLATQNPVDLDYKGLANTGTWFLGRLQTERDKARVLDGLESASGATGSRFDRNEMAKILSGLGQRKFLLHNVHEDHPVVFQTRWALSYLRGPLTRQQISLLMEPFKPKVPPAIPAPTTSHQTKSAAITTAEMHQDELPEEFTALPPTLSDAILQRFLAPQKMPAAGEKLAYYGAILGLAKIHYADSKANLDIWREAAFVIEEYPEAAVDVWADCEPLWSPDLEIETAARADACFQNISADLTRSTKFRTWSKLLRDHIYRGIPLELWEHDPTNLYSFAEESEAGFRLRIAQSMREQNDLGIEKLKAKYASRFATARDKVLRAEERVKREQSQYKEKSYSSFISIGSSILGALMGRKIASQTNVSKAATAMRSAGRIGSEKADIERAIERLEVEQEKLRELEEKFDDEVAELENPVDPSQLELDVYPITPRKTDITITEVSLLWLPWSLNTAGELRPLYDVEFQEP